MSDLVASEFGSPAAVKEAAPMQRWLVRVKSKRGLALRDVFIVAKDESAARHRVQQMYLLSDIATVCPSDEDFKTSQILSKR